MQAWILIIVLSSSHTGSVHSVRMLTSKSCYIAADKLEEINHKIQALCVKA